MLVDVLLLALASAEAGVSLWLEKAEVLATYEREGECQVVQRMALTAAAPIEEARIVHTVALAPGQSLSQVKAASTEGPLSTTLDSHGPLTRLAALARATPPCSRFEYTLSYAVRGVSPEPYRCPLAVALATPRDPHRAVSIVLRLPSGRAPTAAPFPNLQSRPHELVGRLGAMPAFLRVPFGESGVRALLSPHALDLTILAFLGISTAAWWKVRARGPEK